MKADLRACSSSASAGAVPATMEELLTLPGVGRKTANLVLILALQEPARTSASTPTSTASRIVWAGCATRTPEETEQALYAVAAPAVVAADQPVSGDLGAERLPAGLPAVRRLRHRGPVSADRGDEGREVLEAGSRAEDAERTGIHTESRRHGGRTEKRALHSSLPCEEIQRRPRVAPRVARSGCDG